MFTEQPAPPPAIAEVQTHQADAAASQAPPTPAPVRVATPEVLTPVSAPPAPEPVVAPAASSEPAPAAAPALAPSPPTQKEAGDTAKAQRQKEVEQTLLELTSKARAKQKEQQEQQAAADAAKYAESGELEAAEQVINNPALPANVRAALLKRLQAKQAKKGNPGLTAKKTTPSTNAASSRSSASGISSPSGYTSSSARDYSSAPIVPLTQAQMRVRLGQLFGRNLDFAFPLSIPAPITSLFGWRIHPISGSPRFHRGIDFGAPMGTPIIAAKAGRVETAAEMDGYGLTVTLRHAAAHQTLYAHMSQIFVQPGEAVKKGQLLGLVGSTGNSTGPHLHFEVHELTTEGWVALDPSIALNSAIALAQNSEGQALASSKPKAFNLALSGLLDINPPAPTLTRVNFSNTVLASLLPQTAPTQNKSLSEMQVPLTLLPPAIPELSWLISPIVENLAAELTIPLLGLEALSNTVSFNPVPALTNLPVSVEATPNLAFAPKAVHSKSIVSSANVRLAMTKPLAGLTLPEQTPGTGQFQPGQPLPPVQALPALPVSANPQTLSLQGNAAKRLQLSSKRIKPLDGG
ncbi:MAG: M23 family metallopeptidase [Leptolyngbyaceae cyanobacterium bins.302]|nr:M23 family metallopeptidase [Leptolyngbyaceae cyanobacterium bins.302]